MTTFEWRSLTIAALALIVSAVVMTLLLWQLRLLRRQIADARSASTSELTLLQQQSEDARNSATAQLTLLQQQNEDSRESLVRATQQAQIENERLRKRATLEYIAATLSALHDIQDKVPYTEKTNPKHQEFMAKAFVPDSNEFNYLRRLMSYYEQMAAGVNLHIFDLDVVDHIVGGSLLRAWDMHEEWIRTERARLNRPRIYEELEKVVALVHPLNTTPTRPREAPGSSPDS